MIYFSEKCYVPGTIIIKRDFMIQRVESKENNCAQCMFVGIHWESRPCSSDICKKTLPPHHFTRIKDMIL